MFLIFSDSLKKISAMLDSWSTRLRAVLGWAWVLVRVAHPGPVPLQTVAGCGLGLLQSSHGHPGSHSPGLFGNYSMASWGWWRSQSWCREAGCHATLHPGLDLQGQSMRLAEGFSSTSRAWGWLSQARLFLAWSPQGVCV